MLNELKIKIRHLLIWSQKYTRTDMIYLARGGSWLTLGRVITTAASFLSGIAFANLLPREAYGTYKYVLSIFSILIIFTLPEMHTAIIQAIARGYKRTLVPALKARIRWGTLGGIISLGLAGYYYFNHNITLTFCFLIAAIFAPLLSSFDVYGSFLQSRKLFKISTKYGNISQIIAVAMMITALFLTKNIFLILLTYFISHTLVNFIFFKITLKKFPPNKEEDHEMISYGKFLTLTEIIPKIASKIDKILIWHFLGPVQVAIYTFAIAPPLECQGLLGSIKPLILPKLSQRPTKELKTTLPKKAFKLFLIVVPFVALYIILAPFVYRLFFPQYLDSIFYSQIFALTTLFFPATLFGEFLFAKMKKREITILRSFSSATLIILLLILTPLYGIMGALLAAIINSLCSTCLVFLFFKKCK